MTEPGPAPDPERRPVAFAGQPTAGWDDLGRGVIAGWLIDQVDARGSVPLWIGWITAALGLVLIVIGGGAVRAIGVLVLLVGVVIALAVVTLRAAARAAIRRFAQPSSIAAHEADIAAAVDRADLPTGPLSIIRFLWRLRRGVGSEVERVRDVVADLGTELGVDLPPALEGTDDPPPPAIGGPGEAPPPPT